MRTLRRFFLLTTAALVLTAGVASAVDGDADNDGVADSQDNCAQIANPNQADWDADGAGDACDDTDADQLKDDYEIATFYGPSSAPRQTDKSHRDTDRDGWGDGYEVNTEHTDPTLKDTDGDGWEDPTEKGAGTDPHNPDTDGDGVRDSYDNCAKVANPDQSDRDKDRRGDVCDSTPDGNQKPPEPTLEEQIKKAAEGAGGDAGAAAGDIIEQLPDPDIRPATEIVQMGTDGVVFLIKQLSTRNFEITAWNAITGAQMEFDLPNSVYSMNGLVAAFFYEPGTRPSDGSRLNVYWKYSSRYKKITVKSILNRQTYTDVFVAFAAPVKNYTACTLSAVPGVGCTGTAMAFYNPDKMTARVDALDAVPYATSLR